MKVILLKDVAKIGKKYDIKNVSDGHASNMLLPRGLALIATENTIKKIMEEKAKANSEKKVQEDLLLKNIADLGGVVITIEEKANDKGHLFAGIHKEELVPIIKEQTRLDILPEFIMLPKPIKTVGEHEVEVQIGETKAKFKIVVKAKE